MAKMGRPRIEIDEGEFRKLCALQCTLEDISMFFDCSEDTIERWCKRELGTTFAEAFKRYSVQGKVSLRSYQFQMAKKNCSMAIWLGKQWLGQRDAIFDDEDGNSGLTVNIVRKTPQDEGVKDEVID